MNNSKWNYMLAGMTGFGTLLGAMSHNLFFLLFNLIFTIWNYYAGEYKRQFEDLALMVEYEKKKKAKEEEKTDD